MKYLSPTLHHLLYLLNINLKGLWKNKSFLTMTMHCTSNLFGRKKKKNDSTIERGEIWIPFIKLGVKPTSTPGPKRDQLVLIGAIRLVWQGEGHHQLVFSFTIVFLWWLFSYVCSCPYLPLTRFCLWLAIKVTLKWPKLMVVPK